MAVVRATAFSKLAHLLQAAAPDPPEIGRVVLDMFKVDDGHRVVVGDWSTANISTARRALPDTSLHDVKWMLQLIQSHLIHVAHDLCDTR